MIETHMQDKGLSIHAVKQCCKMPKVLEVGGEARIKECDKFVKNRWTWMTNCMRLKKRKKIANTGCRNK